jgi:hypothetical protein
MAHWEKHSAEAGGVIIRPVRCEKCGCTFYYLLSRIEKGIALSGYGLGYGAADSLAAERAHAALSDAMLNDADLVPCPDCHWLHGNMVRAVARRRHRWLRTSGFGFIGLGTLAFCVALYVLAFDTHNPRERTAGQAFARDSVILAVVGVALLALRFTLRFTFNPNRAHPKPPRPQPNAAPALRLAESPPQPNVAQMPFRLRGTKADGQTIEVELPDRPSVRRLLGLTDAPAMPIPVPQK